MARSGTEAMAPATQLFADDLAPGFCFRGEPRELTEERFRQFAAMTGDAHPIHYDPAYAAKTRFGKPIAHGLLLTSLTALGATSMSASLVDSMVAMIEQRWRFSHPAFVGDVVMADYEVAANEPTRDSHTAKIGIDVKLCNQAGVVLLEGSHTYLIRRRPLAAGKA
jgi:3-hydroxybutyryl-CoA dehydratase